jgi:hypothetical protein
MTVRRGLTVAALVAAAAAVLVTLGRAGLTSGNTPAPTVAHPATTGATWPFSSPAPTRSDSVPPPVKPGGTAVAPTANVVPAVSPAPFVQPFADGPAASPLPKQKSPTAPLEVSAFVDGCDHDYGTGTECVPLAFPGGVTGAEGKCAWLAAHGFTDLVVVGRDSQGLDADGDGVACD